MEQTIRFKNRRYDYERTIQTLISADYVPDWDLVKAMKESVQNMLDERTETGCKASWWLKDPNGPSFMDSGRGVDLEQIFIIGDSGKRGRDDLVGQHGEGEVVSFMVAARLGVRKVMSSQDWLAVGRLEDFAGRDVLHIDVYRSKSRRKGTAWCYSGDGAEQAMNTALEHFRVKIETEKRRERQDRQWEKQQAKRRQQRKRERARQGLIRNEYAGNLYTNGAYVCCMSNLTFAYNLRMTPGRDRAVFSWDQVQQEIEGILTAEATDRDIEALLRQARAQGAENTLEFELEPEFDVKAVQRAVRRVSGSRSLKKFAWADYGKDASYIADAEGQGIAVIGFHNGSAPMWVRDAIHNVRVLAGYSGKAKEQPLPKLLARAAELACELMLGAMHTPPAFAGILKDPDDSGVQGYSEWGKTVLVRRAVKGMDAQEFLALIAHELGHSVYGFKDCTRSHENVTGILLSRVVERVTIEPGEYLGKWLELRKCLEQYGK